MINKRRDIPGYAVSIVRAIYPTTASQRGMLLASLGRAQEAVFIEQSTVALRGPLDAQRLQATWNALIERHEILRTAISWDAGAGPCQVVLKAGLSEVTFLDVEPGASADLFVQRFLLEGRSSAFDFRRPPLVRLAIASSGADRHTLVWTHHHAVLDGWSQIRLLHELLAGYSDVGALRPEETSFGRYAARLQARDTAAEAKYWRHLFDAWRFNEALVPVEVYPGQERFGALQVALSSPHWPAFAAKASTAGVTLSSALIACCGVAVGVLFQRDRLAIGVTYSGRTPGFPETEAMLGPLSSTLPVPFDVRRARVGFLGGASRVQEVLFDTAAHAQASPAEIRNWLGVAPRSLLSDCVVALGNYPRLANEEHWELCAAPQSLVGFGGRTPNAITFVGDLTETPTIRLIWDRRRVPDAAAEWLARALVNVISTVAQDADLEDTERSLSMPPAWPVASSERPSGAQETPPSPSASMVDIIARRFAAVLGLNAVGPNQAFLELGGHSLLALELLEDLRRAFAVELPLVDLLRSQTPQEVALRLCELMGTESSEEEPLPEIAPKPSGREPFDLSPIQQAYWVGRQAGFHLSGVDSHIYAEFDVEDLDLDRLQAAWRALVDRHSMLRVVMTSDGRQRIIERNVPYVIQSVDLTGVADASQILGELRAVLSHSQRDLTQWPLFTIRAARLSPRTTRLFLSFDLLIGDAASWQILYVELLHLYRREPGALPTLCISYDDYVRALAALQNSKRVARSREYWQRRLSTLPRGPRLPRVGQDEKSSGRFVRSQHILAPGETALLRSRAAEMGVTPSVLLLALFALVLGRRTASRRFLLNLTIYDRVPFHPDVRHLVGDFTSLVLLEVDWGQGSLADEVRRIQRRLWQDLDYRWYSGVEVLRDMAKRNDGGAGTWAPVVFTSTLEQQRETPANGPALVYSIGQTPQVLLDYQVYEVGGSAYINWDRPAGAIDEVWLERTFDLYTNVLKSVLVAGVEAVDVETQLQAASTAPPPLVEASGTLHDAFVWWATHDPSALALVSGDTRLSYRALYERACSLAQHIVGACDEGEVVAIVMEKGWEQAVSALACSIAGRTFCPLEASWPARRLQSILEQLDSALILRQPTAGDWENVATPARQMVVCTELCVPLIDAMPLKRGRAGLAYIIFTSGTTGVPKGVMISHSAAVNTISDINRRFSVGPGDAILSVSPLAFDLAIYDLFGVLGAGGAVVLPEGTLRSDPAQWSALLVQERITIWNSVPVLLDLLLDAAGTRLDASPEPGGLRLCLLSGDWIPLGLPKRIRDAWPRTRVVSLGGATECSIWSVLYEIGETDPSWRSIPYGRALAGQQVAVLDEQGSPCAIGVSGELHISGLGVAEGYWRDKDASDLAFYRSPTTGARSYRTGDRACLRDDGNLEFLGRVDRQEKIDGYRVDLTEVEHELERVDGVAVAAVFATGERESRRLVAFVKGNGDPARIRSELMKVLPGYMVPQSLRMLALMPKTANGKLDRQALLALLTSDQALRKRPSATASVRSEVMQVLGARVASRISVAAEATSNLVQCGISSVEAIRLLNDVERDFGVRIGVREFYSRPTLLDLAAAVERALGNRSPIAVDAACDDDPWQGGTLLQDPGARAEFRARARTERRAASEVPGAIATSPDLGGTDDARWSTARKFSRRPIRRDALVALVSVLQARPSLSGPKFLYPSAGGLYRVDAYIHVRPDRVSGVAPGLYFYDPHGHQLVPQSLGFDLAPYLHDGIQNTAIAASAAFTIFLVTDPQWSVPLYGADAQRLNFINAGYMGEALAATARTVGLGLCPLDGFDFTAIRTLFCDTQGPVLLHLLAGGTPLRSDAEAEEVEGVSIHQIQTSPMVEEAAPITPSQERLLRAEYWPYADAHYNQTHIRPVDTLGVLVDGAFDLAALRRAVSALVTRHGALRTRLSLQSRARGVQLIEAPEAHKATWLEASEAADEPLDSIVRRLSSKRVDPEQDALFWIQIAPLREERHLMLLNVHQLVSDAWSVGLIYSDLVELYAEALHGEPHVPSASRQTYGATCRAMHRLRSSDGYADQLAYWKTALAMHAVTEETFWGRETPRTRDVTRVLERWFDVDRDSLSKLRSLSSKCEVPGGIAGPILAAVATVVHCQTAAGTVQIASMVPGRMNAAAADLCGAFVNAITIRVQMEEWMSARAVLAQVNGQVASALDNADVPIQDVERAVNLWPSNVTVAVNSMWPEGLSFSGTRCSRIDGSALKDSEERAGVALQRWVFHDRNGSLRVNLTCDASVFSAAEVDLCIRDLLHVLQCMRRPEVLVSTIIEGSESRKHRLIVRS